MRLAGLLVAIVLIVSIFGCKEVATGGGGSSGGTVDDPENACGGPTQGCVIGNIVDADSGGVVSDAIISVGGSAPLSSLSKSSGTTVATANAQGWFFASGIEAAGAVTFCFQQNDYVTLCRNYEVVAQSTMDLPPILMTKKSIGQDVDAEAGGVVSNATTGAELTINAGSVCGEDGTTPVSGDINCSLTSITDISAMPGDSLGVRLDSSSSAIMVGGMMDISCVDGEGAPISLCTGQTSEVRIPILGHEDCGDLATPMQSWGFNEDTGLWNEYATLAKSCGGSESTSYYEGTINHWSWWSAAWPNGFTCLDGVIVDTVTEDPNSEALIECSMSVAAGKTARARFATQSDAEGEFCVQVAVGTYYSCTAKKASFQSNTQLGDAPITELECGHIACLDVGGFSLEDPILRSTLTWLGESSGVPRDLDSYFMSTDGSLIVYYADKGSLTSAPFIELDTDAVSWSGPENMTAVPGMFPGTYRFCVHNFSGDGDLTTSGAELLVSGLGVSLPRRYNIPTSPVNRLVWQVYEVEVDEDYSMTITDINALEGGLDANEVDVCLE